MDASSIPSLKRCTKCHQWKPKTKEYFWVDNHLKDGFQSTCTDCSRKRKRPPDGYKRCSRCKNILPSTLEYFGKASRCYDGLHTYCRGCWCEYQNKRRSHHRLPPTAPEGYRRCSVCKEILPATREFFTSNRAGKNGLQSFCKSCAAQQQRKYRESHPERVREYKRKQFSDPVKRKHRAEWLSEYKKLDPLRAVKAKVKNQRRRAHKANAVGGHTKAELLELYVLQNGRCAYCGISIFWSIKRDIHADHVFPLSQGGSDNIDNIFLTCEFCNSSKNAKTLENWMEVRGW